MILFGIILLVMGVLMKVSLITTIGILLLVAGAALGLLGAVGRPVGRVHYY